MPPIKTRTSVLLAALLTVVVCVALTSPVHALLRRLTLEQMAVQSKLIVTGEVVDLVSYRAPFGRLGTVIFTDVKVRIRQVLKGDTTVKEVTVQVLGGEIGDQFQLCLESAPYKSGEKVLLFLREYNGKLWNCSWIQGKYRMSDDWLTVRGDRRLPVATDTPLRDLEARLRTYSREPSVSTGDDSSGSGSPSSPVLNRTDRTTEGTK